MNQTKHAVILVAGEAKRLLPFTLSNPKCFARVGEKRILENALEALAVNGCQEVRIVIGHFAELIRETITDRYAGMTIGYVYNPIYQTTNSMYSLALGLEGLDAPTWILEGDVFLEHSILGMHAPPEVAWFVDSATRRLDGAYVEADSQGTARRLEIIRDIRLLQPSQSKSIGVLKLTREGVHRLIDWLRRGIREGRQNEYYDLIVRDHMQEGIVRTVDVAGKKWFEIDTPQDLENARELFRGSFRVPQEGVHV
jgi:L-glutamine-phosphate cytidylyltransferase